jgi:esterase
VADPGDELPDGRHAVVEGFRLHYLDWGGDGVPIVFLHGGALTAHSWDLVCQALRDRFRCIAVDQRGHGDSEWSPELDYSIEAHVRDVAGVADQLELGRFLVVGQSLGAMNGLALAARHPDRLAGLAMIDAAPHMTGGGAQRVADFVLMPAELPSVEEFVERAQRFNRRRDPVLLRRSVLHNLRRMPSGSWTWKYDRRHLSQRSFEEMVVRFRELEAVLPAVRCPVLVVRGGESDVMSESDALRLAGSLPDGRAVTVPQAGHTVQGDNPEGLAEALASFAAQALA